jgi:hypothetical protein
MIRYILLACNWDVARLETIWKKIEGNNFSITGHEIGFMMSVYMREKKWSLIFELWEYSNKHALKLTRASICALLAAYSESKATMKILHVLGEAMQDTCEGFFIHLVNSWNNPFLGAWSIEFILRMYLMPDIYILNQLLSYPPITHFNLQWALYYQMLHMGVTPNELTFQILLDLCKSKEEVQVCIQEIKRFRLNPEMATTYLSNFKKKESITQRSSTKDEKQEQEELQLQDSQSTKPSVDLPPFSLPSIPFPNITFLTTSHNFENDNVDDSSIK